MIDWRKIGKKLLYPPIWLVLFFALISTATLIVVFLNGLEEHPAAYVIYVVAFYTLLVITMFCVKVLPERYRQAKQRVYDNKFGNRYMTDVAFRTHISLYASLGINLLYIGINIVSGLLYHTRWFLILAGYYGVLAIMRFILVRYVNKNKIGKDMLSEWKWSRVCAAILTLINLSLSAAVLMMMFQDKGFVYHGMLIYIMALYTFYITIIAIINIVKYRKYHSPILSTTKIINLAAALVSMLSLETAMLTAFGADMTVGTKRIFIAATGAGISIVVLAMSSYMIVHATKAIDELRRTKNE